MEVGCLHGQFTFIFSATGLSLWFLYLLVYHNTTLSYLFLYWSSVSFSNTVFYFYLENHTLCVEHYFSSHVHHQVVSGLLRAMEASVHYATHRSSLIDLLYSNFWPYLPIFKYTRYIFRASQNANQ